MAQLTIRINGYSHSVGCEDGQEPHLRAMAQAVESRIDSIKALGGAGSGEARLLVLAALLMADEIHDLRAQLDAARPAEAPARGPSPAPDSQPRRRRLSKLADRAETIAAAMERDEAVADETGRAEEEPAAAGDPALAKS